MEDMEPVESRVGRESAVIYTGISVGLAALFWLAATVTGTYPVVARVGGMVWVFALSMIITMPIITSRVKRRYRA